MKNTVILIGRITKDIELRSTKSGTDVVKFTLAVPRDYKNADGVYETDFVGITAYKNGAKYLNEYAQKGDLVGIKGRINTGKYEKDGETKYIQEIIADQVSLLSYNSRKDNEQSNDDNVEKEEPNPFDEFGNEIEISDDDLPF